jgi:hypothetical protein
MTLDKKIISEIERYKKINQYILEQASEPAPEEDVLGALSPEAGATPAPAPAPAESDSQAKADSAAGDLDSAIKKAESGWDYSREHGPNTWAGLCKVC